MNKFTLVILDYDLVANILLILDFVSGVFVNGVVLHLHYYRLMSNGCSLSKTSVYSASPVLVASSLGFMLGFH